MAEAQEAEAKAAKKSGTPPLVDLEDNGRGITRFTKAWRAITMIPPRCEECQTGSPRPRWWLRCPHNPYFHDTRVDDVVPTIICAKCEQPIETTPGVVPTHCGGQDFIAGEPVVKPRFLREVNTCEVVVDVAMNGGRGYEYALERGYKLPTEMGISPMCEFIECHSPNPTIQAADGGLYCSVDHARRVALFHSPEAVEVSNQNVMRQQLMATEFR